MPMTEVQTGRAATGVAASTVHSVLFGPDDTGLGSNSGEPSYFTDLNLDQIVSTITVDRDSYDLKPYFYQPLADLDAIEYRQEVFADLEHERVHDAATQFSTGMRMMREILVQAKKSPYERVRSRYLLDALLRYCDNVETLTAQLADLPVSAAGLIGIRDYLTDYVAGARFTGLQARAERVHEGLDGLRYLMHVQETRITVGRFDDEPDYSVDVTRTFERFRQRDRAPEHARRSADAADVDHIEAGVLDLVAQLFPAEFADLDALCRDETDYVEAVVARFDREIQFYLGYIAYLAPIRTAGLALTYPMLSMSSKHEHAVGTYDLALAAQLCRFDKPVVVNDFELRGNERILVVTGPNNGGKTTFARTFGQLHYLARLGCPVPGQDVALLCCDAIYTHFGREENIDTLAGKLQEELTRLHDDFEHASTNSVVIVNEMFDSTTVRDALVMSRQILSRITDLGALCLCVTFLDELSALNAATVSMVGAVVPDDPATRTLKLMRRPADGRAYALALAEKYGLTYASLTGRIGR